MASKRSGYKRFQKNSLTMVARRAGAFLLDILLIFAVAGPCGFIIQRLLNDPAQTGVGIWVAALWNFSPPAWLYFFLSDRSKTGRTIGKRVLKLQVISQRKERLGWDLALGRTAIKLLPWEIVHFSAFALSKDPGQFTPTQTIGLSIGNGLVFIYFIITVWTFGRRSAHDLLMKTEVCLYERINPNI
jgi:uncharacterized RDD family membrane protein YckC